MNANLRNIQNVIVSGMNFRIQLSAKNLLVLHLNPSTLERVSEVWSKLSAGLPVIRPTEHLLAAKIYRYININIIFSKYDTVQIKLLIYSTV